MLAIFGHNCEDQTEMAILMWWLFVYIMSQVLKLYKSAQLTGLV